MILNSHVELGISNYEKYWNHMVSKQIAVEHCLYIRQHNGHTQILLSWIDNLMLFGDNKKETNEIKEILKKEFEVHNLGEPSLLIGMEIH